MCVFLVIPHTHPSLLRRLQSLHPCTYYSCFLVFGVPQHEHVRSTRPLHTSHVCGVGGRRAQEEIHQPTGLSGYFILQPLGDCLCRSRTPGAAPDEERSRHGNPFLRLLKMGRNRNLSKPISCLLSFFLSGFAVQFSHKTGVVADLQANTAFLPASGAPSACEATSIGSSGFAGSYS